MRRPARLKKGATIGLISPSSAVSPEREKQCIKVIEDLGFKVKASDNISANKGGFMAGDEKTRAYWMNKMFADPEVDAIFCVRGGDGGNRICELLDLETIKKNPKIFVGYSDITSFHLILNQDCDMVTYHGPMVSSNMVDDFDEESKAALFDALTNEGQYEYKAPKGLEVKVAREGKAQGVLVGGNLTVLGTSVGTPYELDTKDKILFLEDVGCHIGNNDRIIYQLRNAGLFKNVKGIIMGQYTDASYEEEGYTETEAILDAIGDLDIPVMYNIQSGHGNPMITLPFGEVCTMDTDKKTIIFG